MLTADFPEPFVPTKEGASDKPLADVLERLEAVQDFGSEYKSYGGCVQGTDCSVKFIIETGEIGN